MNGDKTIMASCKSCNNTIKPFLRFHMPLAGLFLAEKKDNAISYPLSLCFCDRCTLVQVEEEIDPHVLFDNYMYKTGTISTLKNHFENFSQNLQQHYTFNTILEIGCNDGTFLKNFANKNTIGVDPSDVALKATKEHSNIELYNTFFSANLAKQIVEKYKNIEIIYASNCFAHIPTIKDIVEGISFLLTSKESIFITEVHWLGTLIKDLQFPFIYHEHVFYYSYKSLSYLLELYNIEIFKVEHISTHGGSIRYYCCKKGARSIDKSVLLLRYAEENLELYNFETFINFTKTIYSMKETINLTIKNILSNNQTIVAYGASGQAQTFLSLYELDNDKISYIVDDSPLKIGKYTSSGLIPIKPSSFLYESQPDYILCLAYTFFNEIYNKHSSLNCKWIIPLPEIKII